MDEKSKKTVNEQVKPKAAPETPEKASPLPPPPPAPAPKPQGLSGALWLALALIVLLGGGLATKSLWFGYIVDYLPSADAAKPKAVKTNEAVKTSEADRIGALEQELKKLRERGAAIDDLEKERARLNENLAAMMKRLGDVEGKLDTVQGMVSVTAPPSDAVDTTKSIERLSERVSGLSRDGEALNTVLQRLAKLEQGLGEQERSEAISGSSSKQAAAQSLVLAISSLRESLKTDKPFAPALAAVQRLGANEPDVKRVVETLGPFASDGVATLETLRNDYDDVARAIVEPTPTDGDDLMDKTLSRIKSLVTVRRVDGPGGEQASVGQSSEVWQNLERGDLDRVVQILGGLEGPALAAARPWLERARARVQADAMISFLNVLAVSLLAPVGE